MSERFDVIVVGGGMVGLALACALKGSGMRIAVLERSEPVRRESLGRDCRVSAIVKGNADILQGIGVWPLIIKNASPIAAMRIWDDQHSGGIRFEAAEINEAELGYIVENSHLVAAMLDVLEAVENVELVRPADVERVEWHTDHVDVRLDDGRLLTAPLVVGADGGRSWLREQRGIGIYTRDYMQKGIVATVRTQMPHHHVAYQRFLPTGPLAFLPLTGNLCSIVWSAKVDEADRLMMLDDAGFTEALYQAFGPVLGRIEEIGERAAFQLKAQLARHLVRERMALIGDAAHVIHPLAGLGVNLGLRDAMVLAQEIVDARRYDEDWGSLDVLGRYIKQRLPDILSIMAGMESFHQLFTHDWAPLVALRGFGMQMVGNSGIIKQLLMRNSTGLSLPVPKEIS